MGYDRPPTITASEGCTVRLLWVDGSPAYKQTPEGSLLGWDPTGTMLRVQRKTSPPGFETWDARTGELLRTEAAPTDPAPETWPRVLVNGHRVTYTARAGEASVLVEGREPVAASSDGALFLARPVKSNRLNVWRADGSLAARLVPAGNAVVQRALFADGDRAVVAGLSDGSLACWDVATAALRWRSQGHRDECYALVAAADGGPFYSIGHVDRLRATTMGGEALWQTHLLNAPRYLNAERQLALSPDGRLLAVARAGRALRVFDAASGAECSTVEGHDATVWCVAVSPDGRLVASGSDNRETIVMDAATGERQWVFETNEPRSMEFLPDRRALRLCHRAMERWNLDTGLREERHDFDPGGDAHALGALDGSRVLVVRDRGVELWSDRTAGRVAWSTALDWRGGRLFGFDDRGGRVVLHERDPYSINDSWVLLARDAESGKTHGVIRRTGPGLALTETHDGLVSVTRDRDDLVVTEEWGELRARRLDAAARGVTRVALSTDGRRLCTTDLRRLALWSLAPAPRLLGEVDLTPTDDRVTALALSSDGSIVALGTARGCVLAFEVDDP